MPSRARTLSAPIADIFVSVQGEGVYCGQKQLFIRFAGCNLDCCYCDEPAARTGAKALRLTVRQLLRAADLLLKNNPAGDVSLTGGEPLLFPDFLNALIPALKRRGLRVHLETNGTLPHAYAKLGRKPDVVAADIKLPSAAGKALWQEHAAFLRLCGKRAFVKAVLHSKASRGEILKTIETVALVDREIPLIWQPATPHKVRKISSAPGSLVKWALAQGRKTLADVSVKRQMHVLWGVK
ncbi:MAG: 7-carboxy-7-deazaguanine synthase QueE [Elusimicrobia bacterium]|nr:7-carboxy-7-deazaguanine synthase QueE [Elusimicrobiota bacterium]